jgi:uncharacterized protein DUF1707
MQKRVGHAERDKNIDHLANMVAAGYLKQHEFDQRRDKALEAVTREDLEILVGDLPPIPRPPQVRVTYQVGGHAKFSKAKWIAALAFPSLLIAAGPVFAAILHGFDHAPWHGASLVISIFAGAVLLLALGISFAPDQSRLEDSRYSDYL